MAATLVRAESSERTLFKPEILFHWAATEQREMNLLPGLARAQCPVLVMAGELDPCARWRMRRTSSMRCRRGGGSSSSLPSAATVCGATTLQRRWPCCGGSSARRGRVA